MPQTISVSARQAVISDKDIDDAIHAIRALTAQIKEERDALAKLELQMKYDHFLSEAKGAVAAVEDEVAFDVNSETEVVSKRKYTTESARKVELLTRLNSHSDYQANAAEQQKILDDITLAVTAAKDINNKTIFITATARKSEVVIRFAKHLCRIGLKKKAVEIEHAIAIEIYNEFDDSETRKKFNNEAARKAEIARRCRDNDGWKEARRVVKRAEQDLIRNSMRCKQDEHEIRSKMIGLQLEFARLDLASGLAREPRVEIDDTITGIVKVQFGGGNGDKH